MILKAIYLSLIQISRSLGLYFFSGGGGSCRRQGKSAAPSGRRGLLVYHRCRVLLVRCYSIERDKRGPGLGGPSCTAPAPRARFCDTSRAKWGVWGLGAWGVGASARCGDPFHRSIFITFACLIAFRDPLFFIA